eukprot:IDg1015t1
MFARLPCDLPRHPTSSDEIIRPSVALITAAKAQSSSAEDEEANTPENRLRDRLALNKGIARSFPTQRFARSLSTVELTHSRHQTLPIMVEIIDMTSPAEGAPSTVVAQAKQQTKPGRKSKFTTPKDLIIVQKVAAAEAHVAPHGATLSRFEKAAE